MKITKNITITILSVATLALLAVCFIRPNPVPVSDREYQNAFQIESKNFAVDLPKEISFAGEKVPLNLFYVREALDKELLVNTYWHSSTIQMLKRANRYFPIIEPILKKNNIPDDFKYLCMIESGLTNVVSPAGASGFWQFMAAAAKTNGLEVTEEVDERYDVAKSTEAACKYLKTSYGKLKNWSLCTSAYNAGDGGITRALDIQQGESYYDLNLNSETGRYLYRILALKLIYENPTGYGFYLRNKDLYPVIPTQTLKIDSTIVNLATFAKSKGISFRVLKELNPWLRKDKLTVAPKKSYTLTLPDKNWANYDELLGTIENSEAIFNAKQ